MDYKQQIKRDVLAARQAITDLLTHGPLLVSPEAIADVALMSDAEVLALKYELRDFLRSIAEQNPR